MDNQDQRKTHTAGHENHGAHLCRKCGWSFPNPHPSAKHRRAHKKICGTIEGYKLSVSEGQSHSNGSDDEHISDDDNKTPGFVVSAPNSLETANNERVNDGHGQKLIRSEDEVFSDAVAGFSDSGSNPDIKERLQDTLDSGADVERSDIKEPKFSGSSEDKDFNDASQLNDKSTDGSRIQYPNIVQNESVKVGDTVKLQGQLSGPTMDPFSGSIADLRTEESITVVSDIFLGLSSDPAPVEAKAMPDIFPEKNIYAGENMTGCSLVSVAKEATLKEKYEINSARDVVAIMESYDNVVGKTCEEVYNDAVSLDHQVGDGDVILKENNGPEINSNRDLVELVEPSDKVVGETSEDVPKIAVSDVDSLDHQVGSGAVNLKEKNDNLPLDLNSVVNDAVSLDHQVGDGDVILNINSNRDVVELVEPSDEVVGETGEDVPKIAVSDVDSLVHQVGSGAVNLKKKNDNLPLDLNLVVNDVVSLDHQVVEEDVHLNENNGAEINSNRDVVELVEPSHKVVGETSEDVPKIAVGDVDSLDHKVDSGAVNLKEKNDNLPLDLYSVVITNNSQEESAYVVQFATSSDDMILQENREGHVNVDPLHTHDDRADEAYPQSHYGDCKDNKGLVYQNPFLHSSESLKNERDNLKETVTEENKFDFKTSQLREKGDVLSSDIDVIDSSMKMELVNSDPRPKEAHTEECTEVSPANLTVESYQRSDGIDGSMNVTKTDTNENHMVQFSDEHGHDEVAKNSSQISLRDISLMASSDGSRRDAPFGSATSETTSVINMVMDTCHNEEKRTEINDAGLDSKVLGSTVETDIEIKLKDLQPGDIFHLEVKKSDDLFKSDDAVKSYPAGEMGKNEQCDIPDALYMKRPILRDTSLPKSVGSHFESPVISESSDIVVDGPANKSNETESRKIDPLSGAQKDIEHEISISIKLSEEYNESVDTSADSHHDQDAELLVKAAEDLARKYTSPLTTEPSSPHDDSAVYSTAVPVQHQASNNLGKLGSSRIYASVDSGGWCDSVEGNWGSVSETLPSTGLSATTEAVKSNRNNPKAASERQQSGKSEMFEPSSFMTLVEARQISPKAAAPEIQKEHDPQELDSTSQAAWFPTLTQVVNESQGRKKSEEIIAKVTSFKEHTPLKSLLGEAAHSNQENSQNKSGKVPEKNVSGLTTFNSILGPESPAAQVVKGEVAKEWNSPARYPADIKREKRKVKSRPYWIQLVCCTSVGPQRR